VVSQYYLRIHVTLPSTSNYSQSRLAALCLAPLTSEPDEEEQAHGMRSEVVKHEEAKRGFVLLPRRCVAERDFAWASRFRRLAKDYERLPTSLAELHFVAFACLFLRQATGILGAGP
jgi:transposase